MPSADDRPRDGLLGHVRLPVADAVDARESAAALADHEPSHVTARFVVEKGGGVPDEMPVEQAESIAEAPFAAVRDEFPDADEHTAYARDVVEAIFESAESVGATSVVYRSRGGGRLMQFLSGDVSLTLVTQADRLVTALPRR